MRAGDAEKELHEIYATGNGSLRLRATVERDEDDIIITNLPFQVSGSKCWSRSTPSVRPRSCRWWTTCVTSPTREPHALVITPKSGKVDVEALMSHLYATTDLERTLRVNLNVIGLDGRPSVRD